MDALEAIMGRRSYNRLFEPAPTDSELDTIIRAAAAAPDHGELRPWKFVILAEEGMDAFGQVLADAYLRRCQDAGKAPQPAVTEKERTKLHRAPLVLVVCAVCRDDQGGLYPWMDQLGAGFAAAANALLAATALGYAGMWRTGDAAWDPNVLTALGLDPTKDAIAGYLYLGTPSPDHHHPPHDPDLTGLVERYRSSR